MINVAMLRVLLFCSPLEEIPLHPKGPSAGDPFNNLDKILEPSPSSSESALFPCHTCGRTFLQKALERHANICQKVSEAVLKSGTRYAKRNGNKVAWINTYGQVMGFRTTLLANPPK